MTRDSGSGRNGEDSRSEAECEAPQSGPAKTGHRPTSGSTQEIINRLKELISQANVLPLAYRPWQYDDWGTIRGGGTDEREESLHFIASVRDSRVDRDTYPEHRTAETDPYEAVTRLFVEGLNALPALLSTLTNLTPSGVERAANRMFDESQTMVGEEQEGTIRRFWNEITEQERKDWCRLATAALALPSEPPPTGDVEGRARERECLTPETYYEVSQESPRTLAVRLRFPFDIDDWAGGNSAISDMPEGAVEGNDAERFRRYEQRETERKRIHELVHDQMQAVGADCYRVLHERDARIGEDLVDYGVRHARWRRTREGERPSPRALASKEDGRP